MAEIPQILKTTELIINCTPIGMVGKLEKKTLTTSELLHTDMVVMDIVYNPIETLLLREAKKCGCKTINGVGMLVHQGALGFELWTGKPAPIDIMRKNINEILHINY